MSSNLIDIAILNIKGSDYHTNLGDLFRGSFPGGGGVKLSPWSISCQNYAKNLKFGILGHTHV